MEEDNKDQRRLYPTGVRDLNYVASNGKVLIPAVTYMRRQTIQYVDTISLEIKVGRGVTAVITLDSATAYS